MDEKHFEQASANEATAVSLLSLQQDPDEVIAELQSIHSCLWCMP